jgi:hypothetical protein
MRGRDRQTGKLFSYVSPEALVPPDHPLRAIKRLADAALDRLSGDFAGLYLRWPRPAGQVGGEGKLFPGSDYAASFRLDAVGPGGTPPPPLAK